MGADGLKKAGQRTDVHVRAALQFRYVALPHVEFFGNLGLRQLAGLPQLMQGHLFHQAAVLGVARGPPASWSQH